MKEKEEKLKHYGVTQAVANILVNQMTEEDVKKLANLFSTLGMYVCSLTCASQSLFIQSLSFDALYRRH